MPSSKDSEIADWLKNLPAHVQIQVSATCRLDNGSMVMMAPSAIAEQPLLRFISYRVMKGFFSVSVATVPYDSTCDAWQEESTTIVE